MAEIIRYVDTDIVVGGDGTSWATAYKTLSAWCAAEAGDLSADGGKQHTVYCRGATADTTAVDFSGWSNASAANYLRIVSADNHSGVWTTSKYRIGRTTAYATTINAFPAYTRLEGLQVYAAAEGNGIVSAAASVRVTRCLVRQPGAYCISVGGNNWLIQNTGCFGGSRGINVANSKTGTVVVNCSLVNQSAYGAYVGFYSTLVAKNCYAGGSGTADYAKHVDAGSVTLTNCYSEDGSLSTSTAALSTSSGARFVSVSAGSEDLHLKVDSTLIDAGADASALMDPDEDVDGEARPSGVAWDVGYDEYVAAVTAKPTWYYEQIRKAG